MVSDGTGGGCQPSRQTAARGFWTSKSRTKEPPILHLHCCSAYYIRSTLLPRLPSPGDSAMTRSSSADAAAPNAHWLLSAGFMAILAAGVGFAIRGGILGDWGAQFGFTKSELGGITGGGLWGFGLVILSVSPFVDRIGYKPLMMIAFLLHAFSAVITLAATPVFNAMGKTPATTASIWE